MRMRTVLGLAMIVMLVAASNAVAQRDGALGRGLSGAVTQMGLLSVEKVQQEIDLTDEQQEQIQTARQDLREARRGGGGRRVQWAPRSVR